MAQYPFNAVIFDLDGVITKTAKVHSAAWKKAFDDYLRIREQRDGESFSGFTSEDYLKFVDGKPRYEGVKSFLKSRNIRLPYGQPEDSADDETVCGIGNRKNHAFRFVLEREGVEVFGSTVAFIKALKKNRVHVGVASSSKNCEIILQRAGLDDLFETRVDGIVSDEIGLQGKPEGDIYIRASLNMGVHPAKAVVVEDATSGVAAGRNGGFGLVLGIARENNVHALFQNGADMVVTDMAEITVGHMEKWFMRLAPHIHEVWDDAPQKWAGFKPKDRFPIINPALMVSARRALCGNKMPIFIVHCNGTLAPFSNRPDEVRISDSMGDTLRRLSKKYKVVLLRGQWQDDIKDLLGINGLTYAGAHGFDLSGPKIEKERTGKREREFETAPAIDWDTGQSVRSVVKALGFDWQDISVVYIGHDTADESAYHVVRTRGYTIHVSKYVNPTLANCRVNSPEELRELFEWIITG